MTFESNAALLVDVARHRAGYFFFQAEDGIRDCSHLLSRPAGSRGRQPLEMQSPFRPYAEPTTRNNHRHLQPMESSMCRRLMELREWKKQARRARRLDGFTERQSLPMGARLAQM